MSARYAHPKYSLKPLKEFIDFVQYGISEIATIEPIGVPMLRMNNLQHDGWDLSNLKYIELSSDQLEKYKIQKGDILFNRTNSKELVGKCEVFKENGDWVFASYLIRVKLNQEKALPEFVSAFLNTNAGRLQIDRVSRQIIGMSNVNAEELKDLEIPLPPLDIQSNLISKIESARAARQIKLSQAIELFKGIDQYLLEELGLKEPVKDKRNAYAVRVNQLGNTQRINADYFHPERMAVIHTMESKPNGMQVKRLADIVNFIRDTRKVSQDKRYFGLANVQSNTGVLFETIEDEAEGPCFEFIENDVLFARLRPYLNKVYRAEFSATCSTEFHVLRLGKSDIKVLPDYLATVLRSSLILAQTVHMMTGNTHPRLTNEDVTELLIPIPNKISIQEKIANEAKRRQFEARRLREEAEHEWQSAKENFEKALLEG